MSNLQRFNLNIYVNIYVVFFYVQLCPRSNISHDGWWWWVHECVRVRENDSRQHSFLHDEGERVEDTLPHLPLQRGEKVRDDL